MKHAHKKDHGHLYNSSNTKTEIYKKTSGGATHEYRNFYLDGSILEQGYLLKIGENRPEILLFYDHSVTDQITETYLSQYYPCKFEKDGITYTSVEQYMMAEKAKLFGDEETRIEILNTNDPRKCNSLGQKVKNFNQTVWDKNKEKIVSHGNTEKFLQNRELRNYLLSTKNKILAKASSTDNIWGIGLDKNNPDSLDPQKWEGQNLLGFAIMNSRSFIAFMDRFGEFDEDEKIDDEDI
jgi:ribA/ribD-fused uncharacterized protein